MAALLVLTAASLNIWALGRVLAADGKLDSLRMMAIVGGLQLVLVAVGLWLVIEQRIRWLSKRLQHIAIAAGVVGTLMGGALNIRAWQLSRIAAQDVAKWSGMVASEERILALSKQLSQLQSSALNLQLPDHHSLSLFEESVMVKELAPDQSASTSEALNAYGVDRRSWSLGEAAPTAADALSLWRPVLKQIDYFDHAKFYIIRGQFLDATHKTYETVLGFSAMARLKSGGRQAIRAKQKVRWRAQSETETGRETERRWRIYAWEQASFETDESHNMLFAEVPGDTIFDPQTHRLLEDSAHRTRMRALFKDEELRKDPMMYPEKLMKVFGGTSPGLAVVDLNRDRHDDLYIVSADQSLFLQNRGDGTFEDATKRLGLPTERASAALFADFDNDGDADVFVGHENKRSRYFINEGGRFVDRSEALIEGLLPMLVSAFAAADYDNDGLLDLYISTYGYSPLAYERAYPKLRTGRYLLSRYLPEEDARQVHTLVLAPEHNRTIHAAGPPNVLLHNVGSGKFEIAALPNALRVFRNTFHSSWADYDGDGDQDIYVANDFAPNNMLRNEGGGQFTDVSEQTGTTDVGFGMGVTWGDYDHDGRQDLYVSNMYSKAGKRIVGQFDRVDERLHLMHRGNSLFHATGSEAAGPRFDKVSGTKAPAMLVEKAGWSWGAQFVDFDNDGWLDIYALSGMVTAPKQFEIPVDI